jgi:hypothetical protein
MTYSLMGLFESQARASGSAPRVWVGPLILTMAEFKNALFSISTFINVPSVCTVLDAQRVNRGRMAEPYYRN